MVEKLFKFQFFFVVLLRQGFLWEPTQPILCLYQTHLCTNFGGNRIEIATFTAQTHTHTHTQTHTHTHRKSFQPQDHWRNITSMPLEPFFKNGSQKLVQNDMIYFLLTSQQQRKAKRNNIKGRSLNCRYIWYMSMNKDVCIDQTHIQ